MVEIHSPWWASNHPTKRKKKRKNKNKESSFISLQYKQIWFAQAGHTSKIKSKEHTL
jgi:hypothetical protein